MVRVSRCDDQKRLVFGTLDNKPLNDYGERVELVVVKFLKTVRMVHNQAHETIKELMKTHDIPAL